MKTGPSSCVHEAGRILPSALKTIGVLSTLPVLIILTELGAARAWGQANCSSQGTVYSCALPAGNYNAPILLSEPGQTVTSGQSFSATSAGAISITSSAPEASSLGIAGLTITAQASSFLGAGSAYGLTASNQASISFSAESTTVVNSYVFGIAVQQTGFTTQSGINLTNSGAIAMNLSGVQATGGAAIWASDESWDSTSGATIVNTGAITATAAGQQGFGGIQAHSTGEIGSSPAGNVSVTNSAPVTVNWTWQNPGSANNGVYGTLALTVGANGDDNSDGNGAGGGAAGSAFVTLTQGSDIAVGVNGAPPAANGYSAGALAVVVGGNGGAGSGDTGYGGGNGAGLDATNQTAQISVTDANVTTTGNALPGLMVVMQAGAGGNGGCQTGCDFGNTSHDENGGYGGQVGGAGGLITVTGSTVPVSISTNGNQSAGIQAQLLGGIGGNGGADNALANEETSGAGGGGGAVVAPLVITLTGSGQNTIAVATAGANSPGISALSLGGYGGDGGDFESESGVPHGGGGGNGGQGDDVTIALASTSTNTQGAASPGIVAQSVGGAGGAGGATTGGLKGYGGDGGLGGNTGNVTVTLDGTSSIATQTADSSGIVAQTLSGAGGTGGSADAGGGIAGAGGPSGNAGTVTVASSGSILTAGDDSRGILAQSFVGTGGGGGTGSGIHSVGGGGGAAGTVGDVNVTNNGTIGTSGANAEGVLLQSIGGSGGAGGQADGGFVSVGGTGGDVANDGAGVSFMSEGGAIATSGISAIGLLGQSIGGGGGDGGGSSGVFVSVGGNGGGGGNGGSATATIDAGSKIVTVGDGAAAVVMQSIGGGGGNAGNASADGLFASVAIGGSGGGGGNGAAATTIVSNGSQIVTAGSKAPGLLVQSIGGGGGTGGNAFAGSIGVGFSAAVAVGGSGGVAGNGATASAIVSDSTIATGQDALLVSGGAQGACTSLPCNLLPVDSYGVSVQSIGGGGGLGGQALAQATAVAAPTPDGQQVGVALAVAVGGTGGSGGNGGTAQFALSNGGLITTNGQGSTAILVQSIGGGGGAGGDSSAAAAVIGYDPSTFLGGDAGESYAITGTFTVGGNGGNGGNGGAVQVVLGGTILGDGTICQDGTGCSTAGTAATSVVTYGDFADGVKAQSIGGGGGDAGFGAGNTQAFGTGQTLSLSIGLGSKGGTGGIGGDVTVDLFSGSGIATYGSGAVGILAQSIGGGGGASQGGSVSFAVTGNTEDDQSYKPGVNLGLGETGGTGNTGGTVTVAAAAPIATQGGDATGILVQSVGGGGGLGGSSGADASADNPFVGALAAREGVDNFGSFLQQEAGKGTLPTIDATFSYSIGGNGGTGGDGGTVSVDLSAPITTKGDWANGIVAQSIGGGGGKAGSAVATGTGGLPEITINLDYAVGGTGGAGGDGGNVTIILDQGNTGIATSGYAATGIVAQSVGGGGGIAADGSDSATGLISVGGSSGGSGGAGGQGGTVTLNFFNTNGTTITTAGDAADGIVLQSIGGGGGLAGSGSSAFVSAFRLSGSTDTLSAGGGSGASGDGGAVTLIETGSAYSSANIVDLSTHGNYAFGILAQSIGGGGGLVTVQPSAETTTIQLGGSGATGNGGQVQVVATNFTIDTDGVAAHGIVAQSIGGGGGVVRVADSSVTSASLTTGLNGYGQGLTQGNGGSVYVFIGGTGSINVTGAGAIGILAQSIGAGGGLIIDGGAMFAGSSQDAGFNCGNCGSGGAVSVLVGGNVSATGQNGIGIFAQSAGYGQNGPVQVTFDAPVTVTGGSGTAAQPGQAGAAGVVFDGQSNQLTIISGATVTTASGTAGTAILAPANTLTVTNSGTITGSIWGLAGSGDAAEIAGGKASAAVGLDNRGVLNAGGVLQGDVINRGVINVGMPGAITTTHITGDFTQTDSGRLTVVVDSLKKSASRVLIDGTASIGGTIVPNVVSLLPGSLPVVTAGHLAVASADGQDSLLFHWDAKRSGNTLTLTPRPDFTPDGVSLTASQASFADHLSRLWSDADPAFATHFAALSRIGDGREYRREMDEYSSKDIHAQSIALINASDTILGSSMECPYFAQESETHDGANCVWTGASGQWSNQSTTGDIQGYQVTSAGPRVGAQHAVAPGWTLGGSFAYGQTSSRMEGGSFGSGETFDGSLTVKHDMGPWLFAGSVGMAYGSYEANRRVNLVDATHTLRSDPSVFLTGGRLLAAYKFAAGDWYVRPYGGLDVIYTHLDGVKELGGSPYALDLQDSDKTTATLSLMVEFGSQLEVDEQSTLRPYAAFGFSYTPDNTRTFDAHFVSETSDHGTFRDYIDSPDALGKIDLGIRFYRADGLELKAGYSADVGGSFVSQSASAQLSYRF
ncbi:MAG TPA: hypothetical protein VL899_04110 [Alphaproteobacteria bacterium]|nr:hypothetical protein [Alphaproteobacteria bacterium]